MVSLPAAEGEKLRLGGWLVPEAFAPADGASIRALLLKLPVRSAAANALHGYPRSLVLSQSINDYSDEEPITTALLWW